MGNCFSDDEKADQNTNNQVDKKYLEGMDETETTLAATTIQANYRGY